MDESQNMQLRKLIEEAMAKQNMQQKTGQMGFDQRLFDKAMSDPQALEAGAELAGLMNDNTAMGLMSGSSDYRVPNGGKLGWTEALSKGIDRGVGLYNILNSQKAKANALRSLAVNGGATKQAPVSLDEDYSASAYPVNMNSPMPIPLGGSR